MDPQKKKLLIAGVIVLLAIGYVVINPKILGVFLNSFQTAYDEAGERKVEKQNVEKEKSVVVSVENDPRGIVVVIDSSDIVFTYPKEKGINIFESKDRAYGEVYIDDVFVGKMFSSVFYVDYTVPGDHNLHVELFNLEGLPLNSEILPDHLDFDFSL